MQKKVHVGGADTGADANVLKLSDTGGVGVQVTGGGTYALTPEATMENPAEADAIWVAVQVFNLTTQANVASITAAMVGYVDLPGFGGFRLRQASGAGTPTSWVSEAFEQ